MADETAIGALVVAAIGVGSGPATAWLTYRWARKADADRWGRERDAEKERWRREDNARRVERGEKAAGDVLTVVDTARLQLTGMGRVQQMDFQPSYHEIRRLANLITDDEVRQRIFEVAEAVFYYHQAQRAEEALTRWSIRAHLRGCCALGRPSLPSGPAVSCHAETCATHRSHYGGRR